VAHPAYSCRVCRRRVHYSGGYPFPLRKEADSHAKMAALRPFLLGMTGVTAFCYSPFAYLFGFYSSFFSATRKDLKPSPSTSLDSRITVNAMGSTSFTARSTLSISLLEQAHITTSL